MICEHEQLPTVEEAKAFLAKINEGRTAVGLSTLERVDFDCASPAQGENCLSARNLLIPICPNGLVGAWDFRLTDVSDAEERDRFRRLSEAYDQPVEEKAGHWIALAFAIPDEIRIVTDPFDLMVPGLRERLEEAGVV